MTDRAQIKNYIKNYFHPYYDITLCSGFEGEEETDDITVTESINFVMPIQFTDIQPTEFFTHTKTSTPTVEAILLKYDNTSIAKEYKCKCTRVIDGDTIQVDILQKINSDETTETYSTPEQARVRLVGVNTPEEGNEGADVSKAFLKDLCSDKIIYLNIDKANPVDKYGRILAVVIFENKNVNQILLEEGLAEIMFIPPSEFNPFSWAPLAHVSNLSTENSNFSEVLPYINNEFNNFVFTNQDDYDIIHSFETYKGMIYLKLYPYNSHIRLHILPKSYDGSSSLLLFKDKMVTKENIIKKQNCFVKTTPPINVNNSKTNSIYEMEYNISKMTQGFTSLQINMGYSYPSTTTKVFHITGIKDETSEPLESRFAFLDANYDKHADTSNNITQPYNPNNSQQIHFPYLKPSPGYLNSVKSDNNVNIDHVNKTITINNETVPKTFHKTIKYINDDIYMYEEGKYLEKEWGEPNG